MIWSFNPRPSKERKNQRKKWEEKTTTTASRHSIIITSIARSECSNNNNNEDSNNRPLGDGKRTKNPNINSNIFVGCCHLFYAPMFSRSLFPSEHVRVGVRLCVLLTQRTNESVCASVVRILCVIVTRAAKQFFISTFSLTPNGTETTREKKIVRIKVTGKISRSDIPETLIRRRTMETDLDVRISNPKHTSRIKYILPRTLHGGNDERRNKKIPPKRKRKFIVLSI